MSNITVTVRDASGAKRNSVSLPTEVPLKRWLSTLVTKLGLPTQQADGRLLVYKVHHKQSGKELGDDDTLKSAGVQENDVFQLVPEVIAGVDNPRLRRLQADWLKIHELEQQSSLIKIVSTKGTPPETYVIHYSCKGISRLEAKKPVYSERHIVEIQLPGGYPFAQSGQTPRVHYVEGSAWHPNVFADGTFCYGKWNVGMALDELVVEIGEIIQYKNYALNDAANLDASMWAAAHLKLFPVDKRPFRDLQEADFGISILDRASDDFNIKIVG